MYLTATLAFRQPLTSLSPSVSHADYRGGEIFGSGPWVQSYGEIPIPMGNPNISKARSMFHSRDIVKQSIISLLKHFSDPSRHLGGVQRGHHSPWRAPTSARPGTDFRAYFIKWCCLANWKKNPDPSRHLGGVQGPSPSPSPEMIESLHFLNKNCLECLSLCSISQ